MYLKEFIKKIKYDLIKLRYNKLRFAYKIKLKKEDYHCIFNDCRETE